MFLVKWFRWLFGYVVFKATGRYPERFLNDAAKQHINLWDIQSQDKAITASVAKADYRSLRPDVYKRQAAAFASQTPSSIWLERNDFYERQNAGKN